MMTDEAVQQEFDLDAARVARDAALDQVEGNAEQTWWDAALDAVAALARAGDPFTTDDIWAKLDGVEAPHEPRAMGAVMRAATQRNIVVPTSEYRQSLRVACHGRPVRVWRAWDDGANW